MEEPVEGDNGGVALPELVVVVDVLERGRALLGRANEAERATKVCVSWDFQTQ